MAYIFAFIVVVAVCYFYKKGGKIIFIAFVFLILTLHILSIISGHSWGDDFIVYLAQAKSLLHGGINNVIAKQQLIQQLSKTKTGPVLYPWGYPVFLAALNKLFGDNYFAYKMLNVFAICLTGFVITLIPETGKRKHLFILFLLIALNPFLFDYKNEINADILLMLFTTLSMLFMKNITADTNKQFTLLQAILAGLTFFLCTFIKAAGAIVILVFIVCVVLSFITNKQKRNSFSISSFLNTGCLLVVYMGALFITNKMLPNFIFDYINYYNFQSILKAAAYNFTFYVFLIKNFVYNSNDVLYFTSILISSFLFILGLALNFRKYFYLNLFSLLFLFILIITPYSGGVRYLLPLLPGFFLYIFLGAEYLYEHTIRSLFFIGVTTTLLLIFCFCVNDFKYSGKKNKSDKISNGAFSPKAKQFYSFLQNNIATADTLIFFKPRFLSFYLNRIAASYYDTIPISSSTFKYLTIYRDLNSNKKELEIILPDHEKRKVFDNGDFQIYYLK